MIKKNYCPFRGSYKPTYLGFVKKKNIQEFRGWSRTDASKIAERVGANGMCHLFCMIDVIS